MPKRIRGVQSAAGADDVEDRGRATSENGCAICMIAVETAGVAIFLATGANSNWLPRLISKENGTTNFTEALNHNQYRTSARFFRNATVNSPAANANSVDCQR
jgi:hypothetical protein